MDNSGKLYIIATPIGNLKDITFRAIETLKEVDYILCEDTRKTLKLLNHYKIRKHLESYFIGNERKKTDKVLNNLTSGKNIGLVSDGGTPCISDPGNMLVKQCHEKGITVIPIPGASGLSTALSVSGIGDNYSMFIGFLPRSRKKINKVFKQIKEYNGNIIIYESPYRVKSALNKIHETFGNIRVFLFKELTKMFECIKIDSIEVILSEIEEKNLKGEYIIIFNKEIY